MRDVWMMINSTKDIAACINVGLFEFLNVSSINFFGFIKELLY